MKIVMPCIEGRLIKRYKRFLADITLSDGRKITAHTANTGSMKGCAEPGSRVWVYDTQNTTRKYIYSWDLVEDSNGNLVGIHTGRANYLVKEAIETGIASELSGYSQLKLEAKYFDTGTRFDMLLTGHESKKDCYIEVKNVTAKRSKKVAIFPDAVTKRGQKHLAMLEDAVQKGFRAVMFFCIQRDDVTHFSAAREIDVDYANALLQAVENGVEVYAYRSTLSTNEVKLAQPVDVEIS